VFDDVFDRVQSLTPENSMPNLRMVVLGDSVPWGQGLDPSQKFYTLVQAALTGSNDH
jgi:hypothetical protein